MKLLLHVTMANCRQISKTVIILNGLKYSYCHERGQLMAKSGLDQLYDSGLETKLGLVFLFALGLVRKCQSNEEIQNYT